MKDQITHFIEEFVSSYQEKSWWQKPLAGFADADDPLFDKLKQIIGDIHAVSTDFLEDAETVISYFLPFTEDIPLSNTEGTDASRKWAAAYVRTNILISDLNQALSSMLNEKGISTAVPPTGKHDHDRLLGRWSQKHVAYIAGLGNFGLHQMLITEKGCCGRLGSLIINARIEPAKRTSKAFCLYTHDKSCIECVEKCIFGALQVDSFDRHACYEICVHNGRLHANLGETNVCGKCVCTVPCSFVDPVG